MSEIIYRFIYLYSQGEGSGCDDFGTLPEALQAWGKHVENPKCNHLEIQRITTESVQDWARIVEG